MNTMFKLDYLRLCVIERVGFTKRNWFIKAFAHPLLKDEDETKLEHGDICIKQDGLYAYWTGELYKLDGWKQGELLYQLSDPITITEKEYAGVTGELETTVGRLLILAIIVPKAVESRFPFINSYIKNADVINNEIQKRVASKPTDLTPYPMKQETGFESISISEMKEMINGLEYIDSLSTIINTATTPKTIVRAPGSKEYRDKLIAEAGESIKDESVLIEIENKLLAHDREFLKDDPVAKNVFTGKSELGRARMYHIQGKQSDFLEDPNIDTTILSSVSDGMSTDPKELAKAFNGLRYGSYARGNRTALGGSDYKKLQRALTTISISPTPCDTTEGLEWVVRKGDLPFMNGRSIMVKGEWRVLPESGDLSFLVGKPITLRSSMYCTSPGDTYCYACMSERYKDLPEGITNLLAIMSASMLGMFMKMMHGTKTSLVELDEVDVFN